jgi:hypothetical protein
MNTNEPQDKMGAADIPVGGDVDLLVIGASRQGRHRVGRRTLTALVSGMAVIGAVGLASTLALGHDDSSAPDRPTTSSTTLSGSLAPGVLTSSGAMTQKQLEILAVIEAKLPGELKVAAHHGIGQRSIVAMAILDSQGYTWVDTRFGTTGGDGWDPCRATNSCSVERVKGGTLYSLREIETGGNSTHYSASYTYERPDGRYVYFNQTNVFDPDSRRSSPPLTDDQVRDMLTSPEWDRLVADCQPDPGPNC